MALKPKAKWAYATVVFAAYCATSITATRAAVVCIEKVDGWSPYAPKDATRCEGSDQRQSATEPADDTEVVTLTLGFASAPYTLDGATPFTTTISPDGACSLRPDV